MNQRLPCFIFVAWKSPSLSMTCVHEKRIIDPKIAITDMKRAFFSSLWIAFHGYMLCMSYWGPIRQWFSFEGLVVTFNSNENRASTQCIHKRAKAKEFFTFLRMRRQKSPLLHCSAKCYRTYQCWKVSSILIILSFDLTLFKSLTSRSKTKSLSPVIV